MLVMFSSYSIIYFNRNDLVPFAEYIVIINISHYISLIEFVYYVSSLYMLII